MRCRLIEMLNVDERIMCEGPSVIAAAATLFVLDKELPNDTLQLKIGGLTSSLPLNTVSHFFLISAFFRVNTIFGFV